MTCRTAAFQAALFSLAAAAAHGEAMPGAFEYSRTFFHRFYTPDDAEEALAQRLAEIRRARGISGD